MVLSSGRCLSALLLCHHCNVRVWSNLPSIGPLPFPALRPSRNSSSMILFNYDFIRIWSRGSSSSLRPCLIELPSLLAPFLLLALDLSPINNIYNCRFRRDGAAVSIHCCRSNPFPLDRCAPRPSLCSSSLPWSLFYLFDLSDAIFSNIVFV